MKPVDQAHLVEVEGRGDCWPACIASILELNRDDVPWFGVLAPEHRGAREQEAETNAWLGAQGLRIRYIMGGWSMRSEDHAQRYVIVVGRTPRGSSHAVVGDLAQPVVGLPDDNGVERNFIHIAHDPHPGRDGLVIQHAAIEIVPVSA